MSEEKDEMVSLLKTLVDKVKALEQTVYHQDNLLMKSGYVVVETPTPSINKSMDASAMVGDMKWDDIHKIVGDMQ
tara:strand:- start:219 stop:443 length:225 start_codon:yes stop_codon:yes gene_type:complete